MSANGCAVGVRQAFRNENILFNRKLQKEYKYWGKKKLPAGANRVLALVKPTYLSWPSFVFHFCLDAKVEQKIKPVFDVAKNCFVKLKVNESHLRIDPGVFRTFDQPYFLQPVCMAFTFLTLYSSIFLTPSKKGGFVFLSWKIIRS